jgi:crotonobetainyl-CoA:carnitine CoA-transferase CaiB-like acyl-CoA transferase
VTVAANLADLVVVDLSESIAGQFCSRLLADYGAEVTLVEPPRGSEIRYRGPYRSGARRPDDSLTFFHLNTGKRSVTLDLSVVSGHELAGDLVAAADVVLLPPRGPGRDAILGALQDAARAVVCGVDDFAAGSEFEDWSGSELIFQALSGVMHENGLATREPLYGCGYRSLYAAGSMAYSATVAALIEREHSGVGQHVTSTAATVAASMNYNRGTQFFYNGSIEPRDDPATPRMTLQCADGWVVAFANGPRWAGTCQAFNALDLLDDPTLGSERDRLHRWGEIRERFQRAALSQRIDDVLAAAEVHHSVVARVAQPAELFDDAHLKARDYWRSVEVDGVERPVLGPFARFSETVLTVNRAPCLGEHNDEVYGRLGISEFERDILRDSGVI